MEEFLFDEFLFDNMSVSLIIRVFLFDAFHQFLDKDFRIGEGHQSKPGSSQGPKPRQAQVINTHTTLFAMQSEGFLFNNMSVPFDNTSVPNHDKPRLLTRTLHCSRCNRKGSYLII